MMHNDANNYSLRLIEKKSCSIGTYSSSSTKSKALLKSFLIFHPRLHHNL